MGKSCWLYGNCSGKFRLDPGPVRQACDVWGTFIMIENTKSASAALKVAAAGLAAGGLASTQAGAQEITPVGYEPNGDLNSLIWTLEGGAIFSDHADKLGEDVAVGGYGAISVSRFIDPDLDWRLSGRYGRFADVSRSETETEPGGPGFLTFDATQKKSFANIDFDIGHHFQHPGVQGRVFVGVRGLHSRETADKGFLLNDPNNNKFADANFGATSEFFGAGPRAGLEMVFKDPGDTFGVSVAGSAAVLLGNQRETISGSIFEDDNGVITNDSGRQSFNEFEALVNLSAAFGVEMMVNDNSTITLGYQAEMWTQEFLQERSLFHGPFVRGTIKY